MAQHDGYAVHPVADLFPMLPDDELAELAADIEERGLLQPIVLGTDGQILDGRNRFVACGLAGVEPTFTTYDGDDPDGYALAVNIARRHLNKGQQAMVAARALLLCNTSQSAAAKSVGVSQARVGQAKTVLDYAPDLADSVVAGSMPLNNAYEQARARKNAAESDATKMARLQAEDPELAALVVEERLSLSEAMKTLDQRIRAERENIAQANTAMAKAVQVLDAAAVDEWRTRTARYWATGVCNAPPTATELVNPGNLRRIAKGLRLLADEMESP